MLGVSGNAGNTTGVLTSSASVSWRLLDGGTGYWQFHAKAYKKQFAGVKHAINGLTTLYMAPVITSGSVIAEAYSKETTSIPLP